jgi:probable F420-dependent oxidoreductase
MDYGICLPNMPDGASREGIEAAAEVAQRLGWSTVWTTDHVMVPHADAGDYGRIYEAILTLAWVGARYARVRLGTSVIVVPQRNAVILAKELATLDDLSGGRVTAGVGIGWNETEFANLDAADRFHVRGAYLDETIRVWRHLWSGSTEPFRGRFHTIEDFTFGPLPVQAPLPIVVGGRAEPALRRIGALADGYHSSATSPTVYAERLGIIAAADEAAGRPMPSLAARVRVRFGAAVTDAAYAMRGTPEEIAAEVRAFAAVGVTHLALAFVTTDPAEVVARAERFANEVAPLA